MATSVIDDKRAKRSHSSEAQSDDDSRSEEEENGGEQQQKNASISPSKGHKDKAPDVHSANNWETADLGDDQRKAKFLKLMGAAKKEHHGRFVIGESVQSRHGRSEEDAKNLEDRLEQQYEHCLADRLHHTRKKHKGLGFADEEEASSSCVDPDKSNDESATAKPLLPSEEDPLAPPAACNNADS